MANLPHKLISLPNRTYQASCRSQIKKITAEIGFSARKMAEIEIIAAEITSNLSKHTKIGGEILVRALPPSHPGVEIICIDNGPGMESTENMMRDGISSTKTLGQGLGAIRRLSDEFDMYSLPGWGTIMVCRIYQKGIPPKGSFSVRTIMVAKDGEKECGDNYSYFTKGNLLKFAMSDGLGHGTEASHAAIETLKTFDENLILPPTELIRCIHQAVKRTRGAVMNITFLDMNNRQLIYCGVGNISAKLVSSDRYKACISYNGIVGHSIPFTLNNHVLQWAKNDVLVMHSDGISARWDLQKYPGIMKHDPSIIGAAIYKDFNRKNDDVTIAVIGQHNRAV